MNPTLEKQRDELAVFSGMDADEANCFCKGFNAAIKLLTESAGELNPHAVNVEIDRLVADGRLGIRNVAFSIARWQHSQDAAQVALAQTMAPLSHKDRITELENENMRLEARLAESESRGSADLVAEKYRLRDKLAASEAEVARMDALAAEWQRKFDEACGERDAALETILSQQRIISAMDARLIECGVNFDFSEALK